jgi:hypothetical protein
MTRLEDLKWALEVTRDSIGEAEPDKRSALLGQFRALLSEIAELEGVDPASLKGEVNGLVILQEELAKRKQPGASGSRSPARRNV